ncbi:hypothetical protein E4U43_007479 [Claviceps pusilla]|uniref:DNA repair protein Rad26 n=1 Tax=Claviceps pusilla TaxID=123648 RepID=A0A9P7NEE5_9HYPO|nr:hypothetical protein E4U43_007479 [Claviceps pusilla]
MEVDEFSDDGFDDLPDNALQELERNAIQLTQAHAVKQQQQQQQSRHQVVASQRISRFSDYGWEDEEDDDLDTTEVTNDAGLPIGRPVVDNSLRQQLPLQPRREAGATTSSQVPRRPAPPLPNPQWNPAIDNPKMAASAAAARSGLHSRPPGLGPSGVSLSASQMHQFPAHDGQFTRPLLPANRLHASQASQVSQVGAAGDVLSALQRRVRVLESELHSARGEASIIRAKSLKAQQEYDAQIARLKKLNAEQLDKQTRMVEAAVAAEKSANTELQFLQQDIREVHGRARNRDAAGGGGVTTPRKGTKSRGFADGFDEMDVALSPSKGQGRGKSSGSVAANVGERTPSKGKRKRPVVDSPIMALETTSNDDVTMSDGRREEVPATSIPVQIQPASAAPFEFLQLVLDHGTFHQQPPTFDTLSRFTFPSEPERTFSSMIFEKLPLMGNPHRPMQLLVDFAELVVSLWARCVDEEVWEPIKYLVALISFTFDLHTTSVAPLVVPNFVPVALATLFTVADARRRLPDGNLASSTEYGFREEHIDTGQLLNLMYVSAVSCLMTPTETTENGFEYTCIGFWRLVSLDMVLLLLTPKQKPSDVIGMLDLLSTSVLPASIGPVNCANTEASASDVAKATIERVSAKLTEQSRLPMTPGQRRSIRLAALRTLIAFSTSPFGAVQLASHGNAIPRLVHCLSAAIDELYDQPIPPSVLPPLPESTGSTTLKLHESTASADLYLIISQSVLLMHRLVTDPATANVADVAQKLSLSHGGSQRYLLSLGRLAFAEEDLVIEAGIEGEVVEAAHELLELAVTPDEGETISAAFGA